MSHFNLISQTNPEYICQENHKRIASRRLDLANQARYCFDSADYYKEADLERKDKERETMTNHLLNPPMIKKKLPFLRPNHSSGKKIFDSADYFLEVYGKTPVK